MTTDYRAMCAELAEEVEHLWSIVRDDNNEPHSLAVCARALLAQPVAEEPRDEELGYQFEHEPSRKFRRAAELLQRQHPQPVPVSEQWPEFSDCDDAEHVWCWSAAGLAIGTWRLSRINQSIHTHWLPANALPVPPSND